MINDNNSFSTIDRLVEFGMGLAVAQQMVNTMNHCIGNMQIAGTGNALGQATSLVNKSYYLITRVRDKDCVKNRVKRANIVRSTLC